MKQEHSIEERLARAIELEKQARETLALAQEKELQAERILKQAEEKLRQAEDWMRRGPLEGPSDEELTRLAFEDHLTGLPNHNTMLRQVDFNVKQVVRYGRSTALLAIDVDRFRLLNETMGFAAGDALLIQLAERLRREMRDSDLLARRCEDEFLLLLSHLGESGEKNTHYDEVATKARQVADRLVESLQCPFSIKGHPLHISISIGISTAPGDATTSEELMEHADAALYSAKEMGGGRVEVYNRELQDRLTRRLTLENQLASGLRSKEFRLHYQPIYLLESREPVGVEALLRWENPLRGMVAPGEFLQVTEETGLIVPLGRWVLARACRQLAEWKQMGFELYVNVNLTARQLLTADLCQEILATLDRENLSGPDLVLDVTEKTFAMDDRIRSVLEELGKHGIRVAIDDFGTGSTNLPKMRLGRTRILKLDSGFVAGIPGQRQSLSVCVAAIQLASSLNMESLAEGIETEQQFRYLCNNGCRLGQGHYLCPPLEASELPRALTQRPGRA